MTTRTTDTSDSTRKVPAPESNHAAETHANLVKDSYPAAPEANRAGRPGEVETSEASREKSPEKGADKAQEKSKDKPLDQAQQRAANAALGLPNLDIVDGSAKGGQTNTGGDKHAMIENAQKTLSDTHASAADKLSSVENLSKNGVKNLQVADKDGKMRDYSIETQKSGDHTMVQLYGKDVNGQPQIALRGIDNGNGTFSQEKDSHGRKVDYQGSNWADTESGKSNVGVVSDASKHGKDSTLTPAQPGDSKTQAPAQPGDTKTQTPAQPGDTRTQTPAQPGDNKTPETSAQPGDAKNPDLTKQPGTTDRAPGSINRSQFDSQLNQPKVMAAFAGRMNKEVGSQGPAAQRAFAEEVMNRAASRNISITDAVSGKYYPGNNPGSSHNPQYEAAINDAWNHGTDTTHGATGNASDVVGRHGQVRHVGFGVNGGHYDDNHKWVSPNQTANIGGERFGMEQVDLAKGWEKKYKSLQQT
jgi:hypothetical protein